MQNESRHSLTLVAGAQVDEWMTKYETDTEEKQKELDTLNTERARDLARLQGLYPRAIHLFAI